MTIVIDSHPVVWAVVALVLVVMFVAGSLWVAAYWLRRFLSKKGWTDLRYVVGGVVGTICFVVFGVFWWRNWSPWAVEITDEAVELKYVLTTERIELGNVERVEFELVRSDRGRERSIVRLSSGGRRYQITQDPEPGGELASRPVRRVFDQLAARLPPSRSGDVTK